MITRILMDCDPQVAGLVSQPVRLLWPTRRGRLGHVPDFFGRRVDGTGVVVDVRPEDRIELDDTEAIAATERVCELAGWSFRRVWSARFCWRTCAGCGAAAILAAGRQETVGRQLEVFAERMPLLSGAEASGDRFAVLPVLYRLPWRGLLAMGGCGDAQSVGGPARRPWSALTAEFDTALVGVVQPS
ncbi:TnsA-like heteromeric transposase endonuclease subunit [Streptomyces asoensis]|uniref:TnsA-like heteromeric transposase endonuclease subunit n=1 Tax=Streptomyces asoensis TaxID=249586 RepID=UPI0033F94180